MPAGMAGVAGAFQPGALGAFPGAVVNGLVPAAGGGSTRGDGKGHNVEVTPVEVRAMVFPQKLAVLGHSRQSTRVWGSDANQQAHIRLDGDLAFWDDPCRWADLHLAPSPNRPLPDCQMFTKTYCSRFLPHLAGMLKAIWCLGR